MEVNNIYYRVFLCVFFSEKTTGELPVGLLFLMLFSVDRYYPTSSQNYGYFTTRTKFILEYIGSADWDMNWYYEEHCQVENKTLPKSIVQCFTSGYHSFGVLDQSVTPSDVQSILVTKNPYCYEWQMAPLPLNSSSGEYNLKIQLWIRKISETEDDKFNSSRPPSEFSRHITKIFYQIGQRPSVSAMFSHSNDEVRIDRQEIYFDENNSVWDVDVMVKNTELLKIEIEGSAIAFLDCYIRPVVFERPYNKFSFAEFSGRIQLSLTDVKNEIRIVQDDCAPNVVAAVNDEGLILTQDYYKTMVSLTIPQHLLKNNASFIYTAVFTRLGSFIIHTGVESFIIHKNSSEIYPVQGLPNEEFQFSSYPWCHQDNLPYKDIKDVVVAWNNKSAVYITLTPAVGFTSLSSPNYFESKDFKLLDVKVNGICQCVYFLVELSNSSEYNNSKVIAYTTQDYEQNVWGNITKVLDEVQYSGKDSDWSFQFLPPNSFSILIWNSWDVFYKNAEGEPTKVITKMGNISGSNSERIIQVVTSNNGEYLVLYEPNVLYYGRIGMDYIVQLQSGFPEGPHIRMMFDLSGYAQVVHVNKSLSSVVTKSYPLDNEIFNALYPTVACPFIEFSFGSSSSSNVLDKWGQLKMWGYLVYKRSESNDIQLVWNPTDILRVTVSELKEFYNDVIMLNKTFTFTERSPTYSSTSSSFSVTILPKLNSMICKRPFHKVFHFHAGCPPTRRVVVRDARSFQETLLDEQSTFSLKLQSGEAFRPVLILYDGGIIMEQVFSFDFVEVNERRDYIVRSEQLEVLNRSVQVMTMSFEGSGAFRFSMNFDDRNTSFCSTTLEFSVFIEEESKTNYSHIEFACVALITMVFLIFLFVNYLFYRKSFIQRHEEDDETKSRLQELQHLAQLQYYRSNSSTVPEKPTEPTVEDDSEERARRAALVTGKSERRKHRRSSVFERVSKGVFEDLPDFQRRSFGGYESTSSDADDNTTSRRSTTGDVNSFF